MFLEWSSFFLDLLSSSSRGRFTERPTQPTSHSSQSALSPSSTSTAHGSKVFYLSKLLYSNNTCFKDIFVNNLNQGRMLPHILPEILKKQAELDAAAEEDDEDDDE